MQSTNEDKGGQKRIYLACPYSSPHEKTQEERFKVATLAARQLITQGEIVFSPITHGHTICDAAASEMPKNFKFWQANCLSYLDFWATDVYVLTIPGWEASIGVQAELALAQEKGLPVTRILPLSFYEGGMATILEFKAVSSAAKNVNKGVRATVIPLFPDTTSSSSIKNKTMNLEADKNTVQNTTPKSSDYRKKLIARIKIVQKQLGMEDTTYREILDNEFKVKSSTKLNIKQLEKLFKKFMALGFKPSYNKPKNVLFPQKIGKIEALLAEKAKAEKSSIPWSYALAILHRQNKGCGDFTTASGKELDGVIAALVQDAKRKGRYVEQWGQGTY